jgi:hypothetical protein
LPHPQQPFLVVAGVALRLSLRQRAVLQVVLVVQDKLVVAEEPLLLTQRLRLELSLLELAGLVNLLEVRALL